MGENVSRRTFLKTAATGALPLLQPVAPASVEAGIGHEAPPGWVVGKMTGAQAIVRTLQAEGVSWVFGIPGAQQNELWDAMKGLGLCYQLVTHELSASIMADGYARASGRPGVVCVVPGPGITNALTGIAEALLDSVPMLVLAGDVARGDKYRAFQVHEMPQAELLRPACKHVYEPCTMAELPCRIREAYLLAQSGEPGPVAVVVPYPLLLEMGHVNSGPLGMPAAPFDPAAFSRAISLLSDRRLRVGIYAGMGCQDHADALAAAATLLQAPVATSISGKGVISARHPLAVGYGYGTFGTVTAEKTFKHDVDVVLAIGAKYGEVATAFYSIPTHRHLIHVDINEKNLGRNVPTDICVHADAGVFLGALLAEESRVRRTCDTAVIRKIAHRREAEARENAKNYGICGVDPALFIQSLRRAMPEDGLLYMDVTMSEHFASSMYEVYAPRTYFNPADNQAMGWSVPAAMGGQRAFPCRTVVALAGDGCFMMSAIELATAARDGLAVKVFVLDDGAYHYMQKLQESAFRRTTATVLPRLDYAAFAQAVGVGYREIGCGDLEGNIAAVLAEPGPILIRIVADYGERPVRWIASVRERYIDELSTSQKVRMLSRLGTRALTPRQQRDD